MGFKNHFLNAMVREVRLIKHLYTKIPEGKLDWRPQENMRSIRELLEYLKSCSLITVDSHLDKNDPPDYGGITKYWQDYFKKYSTEEFPEAMDEQYQLIRERLDSISADDMDNKNVKIILGEELPLGTALLHSTLKYLATYRMQLFLYNKMSAKLDIDTFNAWVGMDNPNK